MLPTKIENQILAESKAALPVAWRLAKAIFDHPETNYQEHFAHEALTTFLADRGFKVTAPYGKVDTAFRADFGRRRPVLAFLAEMDALPGLGHACGHHLIAASSAGAGAVLARVLPPATGTVSVIGTPAEEGGGGKIVMAEAGAFDGLDAALLVHPDKRTEVFKRSLGVVEVELVFTGKAAHAAAEPEAGINALDAVIQVFNAVALMRQQLPRGVRIHGIVTDGGQVVNVIPARAAATFLVRGLTLRETLELADRMVEIGKAAAMATRAKVKSRINRGHLYAPYVGNRVLGRVFGQALDRLSIKADGEPEDQGMGSTDVGNAGLKVPILHPLMRVPGVKDGVHTPEFARAAGGDAGRVMLGEAISALALAGAALLLNKGLLAEAKKEHQKFLKEMGA